MRQFAARGGRESLRSQFRLPGLSEQSGRVRAL